MQKSSLLKIMVFSLAVACVLASACAGTPNSEPNNVVNPVYDAPYTDSKVRLYFHYKGEQFLSGETRIIRTRGDERLEAAVLRELIAGPSDTRGELEGLIHPNTAVKSITEINGILYVTFSSDFLLLPKSSPQDWAEDIMLQDESALRKRLSVYSIVNTLTGLGKYGGIQILIDDNNSGIGRRLLSENFGFTDDLVRKTPLSVLNYESAVVLSARRTADLLLNSVIERNWNRVYGLLSKRDSTQIERPIFDVAATTMDGYATLYSFALRDDIIDADGKSAVIFVDLTYETTNRLHIATNLPIKFTIENETWKVGFDILNEMFLEKTEEAP